MHNRISGAFDVGGNFWREMESLGLILKASYALHGFLPEELNSYFSNISIYPFEDSMVSLNIINNASSYDFVVKKVTRNDVILAVSHFRSQAAGKDGIHEYYC